MDIDEVRPELDRLSRLLRTDDDLVDYLRSITHFVVLEVPHCVGISITVVCDDVPFTVVATATQLRQVDAVQYVDGGPCVDTGTFGAENDVPDVLDERRWHLYAQTAAAAGIRSSLSLPLLFEGETVGALNLYGDTPDAFQDRAHVLGEMVSGHAALAISNADLSMLTTELAASSAAEAAPHPAVERAVGVLMQYKHLEAQDARALLRSSAAYAGVDVLDLAKALLHIAER
jgi:GAF domain-containing protein